MYKFNYNQIPIKVTSLYGNDFIFTVGNRVLNGTRFIPDKAPIMAKSIGETEYGYPTQAEKLLYKKLKYVWIKQRNKILAEYK